MVGAGLAGAFLAERLGRAGWRVTVLEKREDPRAGAGASGRAIQLAVSERARTLLADAGLEEEFARISVPLTARVVHGAKGSVVQPYGSRRPGRPEDRLLVPAEPLHSVDRGALAAALVEAAGRPPGVRLRFRREVVDLDPRKASVRAVGAGGEERLSADLVIGADGARSAVRGALVAAGAVEEELARLPIEHAHLRIPPDTARGLRGDAHHLWTRPGAVLSALPEPGGGFAASLFLPRSWDRGFSAFADAGAYRDFLAKTFPDVFPRLAEPARPAPGRLATLRCHPWSAGRAVLVGDACHTLVPFTSQGANAALEDGDALARALLDHAPRWERAFAAYAKRRVPPMDALSDLSQVISPLVLWLAGSVRAESRE
ncbi:MAG TPA: NAD(P)/FAD-dependent oxidoreductase [Gemmatimonadota bacterium]|nr:NAD(P)/FAD-dependent oxidoreductase [Gemmatimonadota bacterium]